MPVSLHSENPSKDFMMSMMMPMSGSMMNSFEACAKNATDLGRLVMSGVVQSMDTNREMTEQLMKCRGPSDAMNVYKEWMNKSAETMSQRGANLMSLCMELYTTRNPMNAAADAMAASPSSMTRAAAE